MVVERKKVCLAFKMEDDLPPINAQLKENSTMPVQFRTRRWFERPTSIATEEGVGQVSSFLDPRFPGVQVYTCCGHRNMAEEDFLKI